MPERQITTVPEGAPAAGDYILGTQGGKTKRFPWTLFDPTGVSQAINTLIGEAEARVEGAAFSVLRIYPNGSHATGDADPGLANGAIYYQRSAVDDTAFELWQKNGAGGLNLNKSVPSTSVVRKLVPVHVFSNLFAGPQWLAEDGRLVASAAGAGGGGTGGGGNTGDGVVISPETLRWRVGSGYTSTTQSVWMHDPAKVLVVNLGMGQSYGTGSGVTPHNTTAVAPGVALMLNAGVWPGTAASTSFVDLKSPANGEPPMVETVKWMVERNIALFGESVKMLGVVCNAGGYRYWRWKKGGELWNQVVQHLMEIKTIAAAMGLRPVVSLLHLYAGESDATQVNSVVAKAHIRQVRQDIQDLVLQIFGQTETVKAVAYANNRAGFDGSLVETAWPPALMALQNEAPELFALSGASYAVQTDDTNHPTTLGNRELGVLQGQAGYYLAWGTTRHSMRVKRAYWIATRTLRVELDIPDGGALFRDTSGTRVGYPLVTTDPAYIGPPAVGDEANGRDGGWWVRDYAVTTPGIAIGVVSATVIGSATLHITVSRDPIQGSCEFFYAMRSQSGTFDGSNANCARGVFRSTYGLPLSGSAFPVHDWLPPLYLRA